MFRIAFEAPDLTLYVNKTSTTPDNLAGALVEGNALIVEAMEYGTRVLTSTIWSGWATVTCASVRWKETLTTSYFRPLRAFVGSLQS